MFRPRPQAGQTHHTAYGSSTYESTQRYAIKLKIKFYFLIQARGLKIGWCPIDIVILITGECKSEINLYYTDLFGYISR